MVQNFQGWDIKPQTIVTLNIQQFLLDTKIQRSGAFDKLNFMQSKNELNSRQSQLKPEA